MPEYIDREAAIDALRRRLGPNTSPAQKNMLQIAAIDIRGIQAADVAPVRHSYWETYITPQFMGLDDFNEPKLRDGRLFLCHERQCRYKTIIRSNYCPNCGAKMDEEETT